MKCKGYWTKERCKEEALKYETKKEFILNSSSAYSASKKFKIVDEICSHMKLIGNRSKRCIYVYEFSNNSAYIGLTYSIDNRHYRHIKKFNSPVYKNIKNNISYELKQLTKYIDVEEAQKLENFYVTKYKNENWIILNSKKTGGLGGNILKWTYDNCLEESKKYTTIKDFRENSSRAYGVSLKNKWIENFNLKKIKRENWSEESIKKESLKYKYRNDFKNKSNGAYKAARNMGILNTVCSHMTIIRREKNYWTKERCKKEAQKHIKKYHFKTAEPVAYRICREKGWLNEICSHMIKRNSKN